MLRALGLAPKPVKGFDWREWEEGSENICLTDGKGSCSFFEKEGEGYYNGHWFYVVRGKEAEEFATECLNEIFKVANIVMGQTPLYNKPALAMARRMGFKSYGNITRDDEVMELFILTKKEWEAR